MEKRARLGARRGTVHRQGTLLSILLPAGTLLVFLLVLVALLLVPRDETVVASSMVASLAQQASEPVIVNSQTLLQTRPRRPITVAYAVSLIKCGDFQSSAAGMTDAALVMRHSIHQTSARATTKDDGAVSHYDYKMYAIVHTQAAECSHVLKDAGFEIVIRDAPVQPAEIRGDFLRRKIHKEWCCGHDEFIKLFAYELPEPLVVHVDIDFVFYQPMDDVFDALLYDKDSEIGRSARERLPRERRDDAWPDRPQAMMTRDWPQVMPGRKAGYQAGFLVARTNPRVTQEIIEIVKEGNYVEGFQRENGWGGQGYGGFVGAMAMQGLMAYYYDIKAPNTWVELNQCRFNHMGMDVLYRSMPSFRPNHPKRGKCRNNLDYCEDCMHTELEKVYNIHFTQCRKPWNCIGEGDSSLPKQRRQSKQRTLTEKLLIPEDSVHLDHCMELLTVWHRHRVDLETKLQALTNDETVATGQTGTYKKEVFQGHCKGNGGDHYLFLSGKPETIKRIPELYGSAS